MSCRYIGDSSPNFYTISNIDVGNEHLSFVYFVLEYFLSCISACMFLNFAEGKIPQDEPAVLPPLPIVTVPKTEKRRSTYGTPQSRRFEYRDRDWERERERDKDSELMPPPGSHKKDFAVPVDIDQPIDPNEPIYCICHQVLFFPFLYLGGKAYEIFLYFSIYLFEC